MNLNPSTLLPPFLQSFYPKVFAALTQAIQQKSQSSPIWQYFYQYLSQNNFQNPQVQKCVDLTIRRAATMATQNNAPVNVGHYIPTALQDILQVTMCAMVVGNQQLMSSLTINDQSAVFSNAQQASAVEQQLYSQNYNNYNHIGQEPMVNSPMMTNYTPHFPGMSPSSPYTQGSFPSPMMDPGSSTIGSQWSAALPMRPTEHRVPSPTHQAPQELLKPVPQEIFNKTPVTEPLHQKPQEQTFLTCNKGHEMDINVHAVPYFGSEVSVDLSRRQDNLKTDAGFLSESSRQRLKDGPELLNDEITYDVNFEGLVMEAASKLLETPGAVVYRSFCVDLRPKVCLLGTEITQDTLVSATNGFSDIAMKIQVGYSKMFADNTKPTDAELNLLNNLAFMNRELTRIINRFLMRGLGLPTQISSFAQDYGDLGVYLRNKRGPQYEQVFLAWSVKTFKSMQSVLVDNADIVKSVLDGYKSDTVGVISIPSPESITYVDMTMEELQYDVPADTKQGLVIDQRNTPVLHALASTLQQNKEGRGQHTLNDWLCLADGHRFALCKNLISNQWMIYPG